jgi:molybdenum cofactor cytidylyltransferase
MTTERRPESLHVHAVVLAAGMASRLRLPKCVLPAGAGETLLTRVVGVAAAAVDGPVHVVAGRNADLIDADLERWRAAHPAFRDRVSSLYNAEFERGLSTSLRAGVSRASAEGADAVLVILGDQPAVDSAHVRALVDAFRCRAPSTLAVAASWDGEQRTPVVLDRALFAEVEALSGDQGARGLLRSRGDALVLVDWGHGPWTVDIDTWDDYVMTARSMGWDLESSRQPMGARDPVVNTWLGIEATPSSADERLHALRAVALAAFRSRRST